MARDAEASRQRILEAALSEFAERGIAGARVDRIAAEAGLSKGLIYTHFGSKDDLFDAVFDEIVVRAVTEIPIDADDLPEYAGRLFDGGQTYPQVARIATWHRLERAGSGKLIDSIVRATAEKVVAIRAAQERGVVTKRFAAEQVLILVQSIAMMWAAQTDEMLDVVGGQGEQASAYRRQTVVEAVRRLVSDEDRS